MTTVHTRQIQFTNMHVRETTPVQKVISQKFEFCHIYKERTGCLLVLVLLLMLFGLLGTYFWTRLLTCD
jgi:hypothetical protein